MAHDEIETGVRWLAGFAALAFLVVGARFFLVPDAVLAEITGWGDRLGSFPHPLATGARFWCALSAAYMALVTALAAMVWWDPRRHAGLLPFLAVGKATSSLTSLYLYRVELPAFVYLLNFLVDGGIALLCLACWVGLLWSAFSQGRDPFPAARDPLESPSTRRALEALMLAVVPSAGEDSGRSLRGLMDFLAGEHPFAPRGFAWAALAVEWSPPLLLLTPARFSSLASSEQQDLLRGLQESSLYPLRLLVQNLRFMLLTYLWSRRDLGAAAGYPGPEPLGPELASPGRASPPPGPDGEVSP